MTKEELDAHFKEVEKSPEHRVLHDLGFFGHFIHVHAGGRSGKQHILAKLLCHDGHLTQRELLERSHVTSAALSEVLTKLEGEGLVTKTRSDQDKRQMDIALTSRGVLRATQLVEEQLKFEEQCLSALSQDEKVRLVDMLDRIRESWCEYEKEKKEAECKN